MRLRAHECRDAGEARRRGGIDRLETRVFSGLHGFPPKAAQASRLPVSPSRVKLSAVNTGTQHGQSSDDTGAARQAARVNKGQSIKIINTHGNQVVDTWAFNAAISANIWVWNIAGLLEPSLSIVGDAMITNRRRPILTLIEDTSPGRHDTLIALATMNATGFSDARPITTNCRDNLHGGLAELGIYIPYTPPSLNTFMNIPWRQDGGLEWGNCLCKKGDYVVFRAEMDAIVAFSAARRTCADQ